MACRSYEKLYNLLAERGMKNGDRYGRRRSTFERKPWLHRSQVPGSNVVQGRSHRALPQPLLVVHVNDMAVFGGE